jgi:RNA polymerase sigma-70 factor (ECF subfamily)
MEKRQEAFSEIVNQYSEQLYWKIRGIVINHEDANDVLQNTFMKAWRSLDDFQGKSKLYTWLYKIAVNESLDFLRKQKHMQTVSADEAPAVAGRLMADEYFDGDKTEALLVEAIETLPDVQRTVFSLRYFEEMKYSEMSKLLDTSEGSLKASYHIAMQKVTDYLKKKM